MKSPTPISILATLSLTLAVAACGEPPGPELDEGDDIVLSLSQGPSSAEVPDAAQRLQSCEPQDEFPVEEEGALGDSSGVRIAEVTLAEGDGILTVVTTLANTAPFMALDYPGVVIDVLQGDARIEGGMQSETGESAWIFYGIEACATAEAPLRLTLGQDDKVRLRVRAISGWQQADGETVRDELALTVLAP